MTAFASPRASAHVRGFFQTPLDWLVLAVPAAFAIRFVPAWNNASLLFVVAGVGIIPLAGWLGRATEQIAARTGAGIGGFLNATFGNAAELIIALMATLERAHDCCEGVAHRVRSLAICCSCSARRHSLAACAFHTRGSTRSPRASRPRL